jgi:hypothetical protein
MIRLTSKTIIMITSTDYHKESTSIASEIRRSLDELIDIFSLIEEADINLAPFDGSWTAAQVLQHLIKSAEGFDKLMNGPAKLTKRAPDQNVETIRRTFSDYSKKMQAMSFLQPANVIYDKDRLMSEIRSVYQRLVHILETQDLQATCTSFSFPVLGELTRLEIGWFVVYHTDKHIYQLKNIAKHFNDK